MTEIKVPRNFMLTLKKVDGDTRTRGVVVLQKILMFAVCHLWTFFEVKNVFAWISANKGTSTPKRRNMGASTQKKCHRHSENEAQRQCRAPLSGDVMTPQLEVPFELDQGLHWEFELCSTRKRGGALWHDCGTSAPSLSFFLRERR